MWLRSTKFVPLSRRLSHKVQKSYLSFSVEVAPKRARDLIDEKDDPQLHPHD